MRHSALAVARSALLTLVGVLLIPFLRIVHADDAKPPAKTEPWKAEDIIYAESLNPQTRISPDAKWLVWVKSSGDKEKDARFSNLMLSSLSENKDIQPTRGSANSRSARPDWLLWHVGTATSIGSGAPQKKNGPENRSYKGRRQEALLNRVAKAAATKSTAKGSKHE